MIKSKNFRPSELARMQSQLPCNQVLMDAQWFVESSLWLPRIKQLHFRIVISRVMAECRVCFFFYQYLSGEAVRILMRLPRKTIKIFRELAYRKNPPIGLIERRLHFCYAVLFMVRCSFSMNRFPGIAIWHLFEFHLCCNLNDRLLHRRIGWRWITWAPNGNNLINL